MFAPASTTPDEEALVTAALMLRGASAQAWDTFLAALQAHANTVARSMVTAPLDQLVLCQGRAQNASTIVKILREAPERFDAIRNRKALDKAR